jgi:hypothetical protein
MEGHLRTGYETALVRTIFGFCRLRNGRLVAERFEGVILSTGEAGVRDRRTSERFDAVCGIGRMQAGEAGPSTADMGLQGS